MRVDLQWVRHTRWAAQTVSMEGALEAEAGVQCTNHRLGDYADDWSVA